MKEKVQRELEMNQLFEPIFSDNVSDPRYFQVFGGRGSGKSFTVSIAAVLKTYSKYKHKILYLRQVMATADDSVIADVIAAIHILGKTKDFRIKKNLITNIRTGSTISFKGVRTTSGQTAKLKSLSGITTLIIEEAEEIEDFETFSKVDESIRTKGKPLKVILVYNPTTSIGSWIHKEWFDSGLPKQSRFIDTMFIHSTYLDNLDNLAESTISQYKRLEATNPVYYANTIMAEWTLEAEGRIYDAWAQYPYMNEPGQVWYGMDFGYGGNDKTSCVKITYLDKMYFVEEMFSEAKQSINKTASEMRRCNIPFNARIYADSAMPLLITEIRAKGFTGIRKALKGNVEAGIKKIQNKEIVLVGGTETDLYYSYMTFRRDKKGKLPHEPDILASMRYGINSKVPMKNQKKEPKRSALRRKATRKRGDFM